MVKKLASKLLFASAALWMVSGAASAATLSCSSSTEPAYDISGKVTGTSSCLILSPLDGAQNDSVTLVNNENFFGISNWSFDGKYEEKQGSPYLDGSALFSFTGGGQTGTYTFNGVNSAFDSLMLVFKEGQGTNLVAYLLEMPAGTGSYSSPFINPPFAGNNAKDVSHISVYYVADEGGGGGTGIPEPGTTAIIGLGLLGMGLAASRRKSRQS